MKNEMTIEHHRTILTSSVNVEERSSQGVEERLSSFLNGHLKKDTLEELEAHDQYQKLMESYHSSDWKLVGSKRKKNVFSFTRKTENSKILQFRITGEFEAPIDLIYGIIEDMRTLLEW